MSASSPPPPSASSPSVPQPRPCAHNVPYRTSTAGHQRSSAASVPCRASTARQKICQIERQKGHTICQKTVRKNVRRYARKDVRKDVRTYARKNVRRNARKDVRKNEGMPKCFFFLHHKRLYDVSSSHVLEHALLNCT